jgi:nucleotide-binding universal stress UspA family protein
MAPRSRRTSTEGPLRVLVGSARPSTISAALTRALALPSTDRLAVLHVMPPGASARSEALRQLAEVVAKAAGGRQPPVIPLVDRGDPHERIVLHGRMDEVDLIVLDRHLRRSPVREFFLGTTAERVVRTSSTPVLVVQGPPGAPYERPLVALDLSPASLDALELTLRVARPTSGVVDVVHVFETPNEMLYRSRHMNLAPEAILAYRRECKREARSRIEAALARFERSGLRFRIAMRLGDPRSAVLREARKRCSDLIALGTRGRSNLGRMLLGSVASEVLGTATCDVLVAPGPA